MKEKKKVLITGAGGFIGSHLAEELLAKDFSVTAFVHYNSFGKWGWLDSLDEKTRDKLTVIAGDIRDPNGVREAMKEVDTVFHLAALIGIPYSYHSPDSYVDTNIRGTLNLLQAARDSGIRRFIHTSTSEIYGTAQFVPISEDHPVNPQSPYAATKSGADHLALSFYRTLGTPVIILRPFNSYGPRQSTRAIVPTIITQILRSHGTISLGSLHPTRDMNFVRDTTRAFLLAAEADHVLGEVINVGSGTEISIGDLAIKIAAIMGKKIKIETSGERIRPDKSEVERLLADHTKARKLLNWAPAFSLDRGLEETIRWFSQPGNQSCYKPSVYSI